MIQFKLKTYDLSQPSILHIPFPTRKHIKHTKKQSHASVIVDSIAAELKSKIFLGGQWFFWFFVFSKILLDLNTKQKKTNNVDPPFLRQKQQARRFFSY